MSLHFITGGARSGKSRHAAQLAADRADHGGQVAFIATAQIGDDEMATRIRRHREERPANWMTMEEPRDVAEATRRAVATGYSVVLVDCLTLLISNRLCEPPEETMLSDEREVTILEEARGLALFARGAPATVLVVSNEVGMGIVPENPLARRFRDIAGRANQILADAAQEVTFCVSGIPLRVKGS